MTSALLHPVHCRQREEKGENPRYQHPKLVQRSKEEERRKGNATVTNNRDRKVTNRGVDDSDDVCWERYDIYAYNNDHSFTSNTKGYGGKTH
jgi:hypothetical protein